MNKLRVLIGVIGLSCGLGEIAGASIIYDILGTPTLNGDTAQVGVVSGGSTIFYIPLDPDGGGTYGDGAIGTTIDTVRAPINGGLLHMYMHFVIPSGEVGTDLKLSFTDLDLEPWNDPPGFFERLTLYGQHGLPNGAFDTIQTLEAQTNVQVEPDLSTTSNDMDIYISGLSIPSGDFWLHMGLQAYSVGLSGTWTNTKEKLTTAALSSEAPPTTSNIPEPSTLLLLASGILGAFGYGLRRKKNG